MFLQSLSGPDKPPCPPPSNSSPETSPAESAEESEGDGDGNQPKLFSVDSTSVITVILLFLCVLAGMDLWRQYAINNEDFWFYQYSMAVRSSEHFWKLGFHLEDLEHKIHNQKMKFEEIRHTVGTLNPPLRHSQDTHTRRRKIQSTIHSILGNDSAIFQIRCEKAGPVLRVGLNDFRADARDMCHIFPSSDSAATGPHTMFERVPLDEGAFALKNIGSELFMQVMPPASSAGGWKLMIGGPSAGAAERFRLTPEGYLYSPLTGGFLQCKAGQNLPVEGYTSSYSAGSSFVFEPVGFDEARHALELVDLSRQISFIQSEYIRSHQTSVQERREQVSAVTGLNSSSVVKMCIAVPMTSKGTVMEDLKESPIWANLFDSFMRSIDWRSNRIVFKFYLGFDKADEMYDTGDSWSDLREEFRSRAEYRMSEQLMEAEAIQDVLKDRLTLKLMHFEHLQGAPTQVVSQLVLQAYADEFDYFYQVNDDTILVTPNWAPKLIAALASNPSIPNFGVAGPVDTNNDKIFTHSFVHRTHIEVFGHLFPPSFKNWWSDDWITTVYGSEHTFRVTDVEIKHNVGAQKSKGYTRYEVDHSAQLRLLDELRKGHVQVSQWLKKNSLPRLPLPQICGYIPLVSVLTGALKEGGTAKVVVDKDGGPAENY